MIYLDSSAFVKLAGPETESDALREWLVQRADLPMVSSVIARAEVPRAVWRGRPEAFPGGYRLVRRVNKIPLTDALLDEAAVLPPRSLRTLDAIHLASALAIGPDLTTFVGYDERLLAVARQAGLDTASPA